MIKFILAISTIVIFTNNAKAELFSKDQMAAELGALYLTQDDSGNTFTALPMLSYQVIQASHLQLVTKLGATAYKDEPSDKTFFVGVLHVNPAYRFQNSPWGIEGVLGFQYWEEEKQTASEIGARVNYDVTQVSRNYLDDIFFGGSLIQAKDTTTSVTLGGRKNF